MTDLENYFNYFTEIEEHFARLRSRNLLISPLDWCLIELWKETGIPLEVVLRGLDRSFESAARSRRRTPLTLHYCHPAVMEAYEEYRGAMIGAEDDQMVEVDPGIASFLGHLRSQVDGRSEAGRRVVGRLDSLLEQIDEGTIARLEELDRELSECGRLLAEEASREMDSQEFKELKKTVRKELKLYKKHLSDDQYQQLQKRYLDRRVREHVGLPEFSLLQIDQGGVD